MKLLGMVPLHGIDTDTPDSQLDGGPEIGGYWLREATNVDIDADGHMKGRGGELDALSLGASIWQHPLTHEVFSLREGEWVKDGEVLGVLPGIERGWHTAFGRETILSCEYGLYHYKYGVTERLTLDQPGAPMVLAVSDGSLAEGTYSAGFSWVRGTLEGPLSPLTSVHVAAGDQLHIFVPPAFDGSVTAARLYLTDPNGAEPLYVCEAAPDSMTVVALPSGSRRTTPFPHKVAMPAGKFVTEWRGRLWVALGNRIVFSEPMAYHVTDPRHGFIQFPESVTFMVCVEGGIWVGQRTGVMFLAGKSPAEMSVVRTGLAAPVPESAILVPPDVLPGELAESGQAAALWLAENGYVIGLSNGKPTEVHKGKLSGISAERGTTVLAHGRVTTLTL